MEIHEALAELARRAEPGGMPCLRCTAIVRRYLKELAAADEMGAGWDLADDDIQAEVDAMMADRPELAERYGPDGRVPGTGCPSED